MPLDPTGHLLHEARLPRQGVKAALPNTQKQTQGGCQNEETKNTAQIKEQIKTPEKELNKMEISNPSDAEFKTLAIRMLREHGEDLSSIKKIQSETKDILIKIKNNLQGNNSSWMKLRIKSMVWNKMDGNGPTPRHIVNKMPSVKDKDSYKQ